VNKQCQVGYAKDQPVQHNSLIRISFRAKCRRKILSDFTYKKGMDAKKGSFRIAERMEKLLLGY